MLRTLSKTCLMQLSSFPLATFYGGYTRMRMAIKSAWPILDLLYWSMNWTLDNWLIDHCLSKWGPNFSIFLS